ncbi:MAG: hypothetical protein MSH30_08480 [Campylobacter sp.]|uniref:hypothetical protein n=1 Tax=Campylobacter sp. TaxID=205 RepID=UPI002A4BFC9C|nr:hypothetical protein [Campylobacter sp.]MDD6925660.1 hypothetical protein [Campylobacteraceae bacterium]MCI6177798.1 hypothetical protein [Campylobacter sp.]MCI6298565.1 hypothetical protein [Campylobacter sp.]MCI6343697.1 hypothetical protein [Campylobacter sp.]MCI7363340.1 hypothetical protein [Campylobacter sp.]
MSNIKNPTRIQVSNESLDYTKNLGIYSAIANSAKERLEYLRKKEIEKAKQGQKSGE